MAGGKGKVDAKGVDKGKGAGNKGKSKTKDGGDDDKAGGSGKLKAANSINVRHILVRASPIRDQHPSLRGCPSARNIRRRKMLCRRYGMGPSLTRWPGSSPRTRPDKVSGAVRGRRPGPADLPRI